MYHMRSKLYSWFYLMNIHFIASDFTSIGNDPAGSFFFARPQQKQLSQTALEPPGPTNYDFTTPK